MIVKAIVTYDDGAEVTFAGTPEVIAVPAGALDLSTVPTQSPNELMPVPELTV